MHMLIVNRAFGTLFGGGARHSLSRMPDLQRRCHDCLDARHRFGRASQLASTNRGFPD